MFLNSLIEKNIVVMKKIILLNLLVSILLFGCRPENFKPVGEANNYMALFPGTYKLTSVVQSDVKALKNNYPYKSLNVTSIFPYTDFEMTLNSSGTGPGTFTTKKGNSPDVIKPASGNWSVDNPEAPKMMYFVNGRDSARIEIANYTGFRDNKLNLRLVKYLDGKAVTNYDYEFTKN
jgi:hypothetical protein